MVYKYIYLTTKHNTIDGVLKLKVPLCSPIPDCLFFLMTYLEIKNVVIWLIGSSCSELFL